MPVTINEMTSKFEIRDEPKIRKLVREEIKAALCEDKRKGTQCDPSDPGALGRPGENGG
jgi:hypothetical protein